MCLAFPGRIMKINGDTAIVDFDGVEKDINISLIKSLQNNDFVMVHAGFAIAKMSGEDAMAVFKLYKEAEGK